MGYWVGTSDFANFDQQCYLSLSLFDRNGFNFKTILDYDTHSSVPSAGGNEEDAVS